MNATFPLVMSATLIAGSTFASKQPAARTINNIETTKIMNALNPKEESIARLSAYTAKGDLPNLKLALAAGLDAVHHGATPQIHGVISVESRPHGHLTFVVQTGGSAMVWPKIVASAA